MSFFCYDFYTIFKIIYFVFHKLPANVSFRNQVHKSIKIMRGLHKLILSTNKMTVVEKQDSIVCWNMDTWWNCYYCGITNTNIKRNYQESMYLFCCNYEQSSETNQCTWCSPLKYGRIFSIKKLLMRGQKLSEAKKLLGVCSKQGRSFINDKCILQQA